MGGRRGLEVERSHGNQEVCSLNPAYYFSNLLWFLDFKEQLEIAKRKVTQKNHEKDEKVRGRVVKKMA